MLPIMRNFFSFETRVPIKSLNNENGGFVTTTSEESSRDIHSVERKSPSPLSSSIEFPGSENRSFGMNVLLSLCRRLSSTNVTTAL